MVVVGSFDQRDHNGLLRHECHREEEESEFDVCVKEKDANEVSLKVYKADTVR